MKLPQGSLAIACCTVLLASILGLIAAFMLSLAAARHNLDRAAISEGQLAMVARIEAALHDEDASPALNALLHDYRASIGREAALLHTPRARAAEAEEQARADRLVTLAAEPATPNRTRQIRALVATISGGEQAEASEVAVRMGRLRRDMTALAILLTIAAIASAAMGGFGLFAANRGLAKEVAIRTEKLATIERSRRLFFAKVSHELRTPVTVMRGEAEVAMSDPRAANGVLREALGHVVSNAEFLEHRIAELLSLARTDSGELILDDAEASLGDILSDATAAAAAYARSLEVRLDIAPTDGPLLLRGDRRWLQQALVAVLDNAVKFSPAGGTVSLRTMTGDDRASIEIGDRGPGITPGELPRIFEAYYQAEEGRGRGGTGLGLALARWVVERHGGTISARNDPEGGCVMTIDLPLAA